MSRGNYGTSYTNSLVAAGTLLMLEVGMLDGVGVQVTSPGTSCTVTYEFSVEDTPVNWRTCWGYDPGANSPSLSSSTTTAGFLLFNVQGAKWFRARVSTYTSGTVTAAAASTEATVPRGALTVSGAGSNGATTNPNPVVVGGYDGTAARSLSVNNQGTVRIIGEAQPAASTSTLNVQVGGHDGTFNRVISTTAGGAVNVSLIQCTPTTGNNQIATGKIISAAGTNAGSLRAVTAKLQNGSVSNLTAAFKFLKLYNKNAAPVVGTDVPMLTIPLPPNSTIGLNDICGMYGIYFSAGIAYAITGAVVDTDTTAVAAGDVVANLGYC